MFLKVTSSLPSPVKVLIISWQMFGTWSRSLQSLFPTSIEDSHTLGECFDCSVVVKHIEQIKYRLRHFPQPGVDIGHCAPVVKTPSVFGHTGMFLGNERSERPFSAV